MRSDSPGVVRVRRRSQVGRADKTVERCSRRSLCRARQSSRKRSLRKRRWMRTMEASAALSFWNCLVWSASALWTLYALIAIEITMEWMPCLQKMRGSLRAYSLATRIIAHQRSLRA